MDRRSVAASLTAFDYERHADLAPIVAPCLFDLVEWYQLCARLIPTAQCFTLSNTAAQRTHIPAYSSAVRLLL